MQETAGHVKETDRKKWFSSKDVDAGCKGQLEGSSLQWVPTESNDLFERNAITIN